MTYREAVLNGTRAAAGMHEALRAREAIESQKRGSIDVFDAILQYGASLVFRPLDGLLGACVNGRGIIISTVRPLPIQRFTGAHELGHLALRHEFSLDGDEILSRSMSTTRDMNELEADAFAGEFLLPRWLLAYHARSQEWGAESMHDPSIVYQLSLRAGASYEATVRSLDRNSIINRQLREQLLTIAPRTIKQQLLPGYSPDHWHRDVWLVTERDEGALFEGQPEDLFLFRLNEKSGAGYLWDFEQLKQNGFAVLSDQIQDDARDEKIGADVIRVLAAHSPKQPRGKLHFALRRPWQPAATPAAELNVQYNVLGKEVGLPRAKRPALALAA